jgi:hypothetical protein
MISRVFTRPSFPVGLRDRASDPTAQRSELSTGTPAWAHRGQFRGSSPNRKPTVRKPTAAQSGELTDELAGVMSLGDTLRDDEAREHMRDTGRKLSDALKITLMAFSEEIRRAVGSRRSPDPSESPPRPRPPPADPGVSA